MDISPIDKRARRWRTQLAFLCATLMCATLGVAGNWLAWGSPWGPFVPGGLCAAGIAAMAVQAGESTRLSVLGAAGYYAAFMAVCVAVVRLV